MKMILEVSESQAKALTQFCTREAKDAYYNHCAKRQADGVESLFSADLQEAQQAEAQLAIDWYNLAQSIVKQAVGE